MLKLKWRIFWRIDVQKIKYKLDYPARLFKWLGHAILIQKSGVSGGQQNIFQKLKLNFNFLTYLKTSKPFKSGCDFTLSGILYLQNPKKFKGVVCNQSVWASPSYFFLFRRDAITCVRRPCNINLMRTHAVATTNQSSTQFYRDCEAEKSSTQVWYVWWRNIVSRSRHILGERTEIRKDWNSV